MNTKNPAYFEPELDEFIMKKVFRLNSFISTTQSPQISMRPILNLPSAYQILLIAQPNHETPQIRGYCLNKQGLEDLSQDNWKNNSKIIQIIGLENFITYIEFQERGAVKGERRSIDTSLKPIIYPNPNNFERRIDYLPLPNPKSKLTNFIVETPRSKADYFTIKRTDKNLSIR